LEAKLFIYCYAIAEMTASCSAIILSASASLLPLLPVMLTRGRGGGCGC
jgi:hypothetical protein